MIVNKQLAQSKGADQKDKWRTPAKIFKPLDEYFGFDLDPCCEEETALCPHFFTPERDGLKWTWIGLTVFCNPPYSRGNIDKWVEKCYKESLKEGTIVVALLPVSTSADWWHKWIIGKGTLLFVDKRVRFVGAPNTAPFSSVIVVFGEPGMGSFCQKTGEIKISIDHHIQTLRA